jgi:hypothetical protein
MIDYFYCFGSKYALAGSPCVSNAGAVIANGVAFYKADENQQIGLAVATIFL